MEKAQVRDIMTEEVLTAMPTTLVSEIVKILNEKGFSGVPIVNEQKELVGLVTEYELINQREIIDFLIKDPESESLHQKVAEMMRMTAQEIMNKEPLTLFIDDNFEDALLLFNKHHRVNPVPVIAQDKKLVGIVSRYDLIKLLRLYGYSG